MKKVIIALAFLAGLSGCAVMSDSDSWRYRMTVNVETPEGMKSGSAVREVTITKQPFKLPESSYATKSVKGEAVVVDMGDRGQLFALLRSPASVDHGYRVVYEAFPNSDNVGCMGNCVDNTLAYYPHLDAKRELPLKLYPMFVHFKNPQDPTSVELVLETKSSDPSRKDNVVTVTNDRFEEIYGKGVKLHSVTLEMTDDPVTTGIEKWLPWLPGRKNVRGTLGGGPEKPFEDPTGLYLNGVEFSQGVFW